MNNWSFEAVDKLQPVAIKQIQSLIQKKRIGHAYIIEGAKGTGKVKVMQFFVQLILCESPVENVPCETCRSCKRLKSNNHLNFKELEPDGQFIKRGQIDDLIQEMSKTAIETGRKIYVIHHADQLNASAANTLLKFLEEPQSEITALLLTDRMHALIPTIRSRCQHISLAAMPQSILKQRLVKEGITDSMASTVCRMTNQVEEAIILAKDEQFGLARKSVLKLVEASGKSVQDALMCIHEDFGPLLKEKEQAEQALDLLLFAYRDIVAIKASNVAVCTYPDMIHYWNQVALQTTYEQLSKQLEIILHAKQNLHKNMNRTLMMEQLMLNLQEVFTFV
ncbi:DNA polymerase III subunit delta' C-terminal domain-containing protein [Psychrobacillus lasiicapitis]|uniref:DNA polymerase III subunit delta' n=1 Tax=Psychrobacillus lasiicapitis TaxID=1636719 RepID=A0A544SST8_9BACI|nr:DNA polymerase III subunit delta' C-terminal domain-containing protein [Psychrobacillus lasiicapitis]TQR08263.1 DNA polymerase III subunit delta' [Psychrobacillus lasiicapitis]GGA48709.1 DNA polymerase III subunit delta' [Psychrobacillus lasiicapitis]